MAFDWCPLGCYNVCARTCILVPWALTRGAVLSARLALPAQGTPGESRPSRMRSRRRSPAPSLARLRARLLGERRTLDLLIVVAGHPDATVRKSVVMALGGGEGADAVAEGLDDEKFRGDGGGCADADGSR